MKKKQPVLKFQNPTTVSQTGERNWHNGADIEMQLNARSLQQAARALVERLHSARDSKAAWDACPAVLLYRTAIELRMKALVGADRRADHPGGEVGE